MSLYKRLLSIQNWNISKSVIGLQDKVFKSCKRLTPAYKEWGSNLDIYLSPCLNVTYQGQKYLHLFIKRGPSVKLPLIYWFLIMDFNFD